MDFLGGAYIYINKPYRMSSFGALAHIRYVLSKRLKVKRVKMGHAGTLDPLAEHAVDQTYPTAHITRELIEQTLPQFVGDIMQRPPLFSACKVGGDRAYELARQGSDHQLAAKPVRIDEIELLDFDPEQMQMKIRVVCGKGTYIRSLARDIGEALDSGAHLTALCRTRVGDVRIEDCLTFDEFPAWLEENLEK